MGSVSTKEEMENEAIDETSNSVTANIDTDSSFESIDEITIETEEKHKSLKEKVNEQNSQEEPINDMNKQETNDEVSKLTKKFKNAHIQEQTPILDPKVQGRLQKSKYHRCFMVTGSTNKDTGVTKSIFDAQHANNDKIPPGESGTSIPLENQFHQPGSSQTVTQSYVLPTQQNNYQPHGQHAFISSIDPLTVPLPTVQGINNGHPISSFPHPSHLSTLAPASQQQHFSQMDQHNQCWHGTDPRAGYGTEQSNVNWNPAPNHNPMQATTYYQPPQQPTFVPAPQQQHFPQLEQHNQVWPGTDPRAVYGTEQPNVNWNPAPNHSQMQTTAFYHLPQRLNLAPASQQQHFSQMEQHNQGWPGTGSRAGYGTEPGQQNMNCIPDQYHNQMQAMVITNNITNHPAPINHPSTSASQCSHTGKKGRPRLSDELLDKKSIKARDYNKKKRDFAKLGAKISDNLDSFCEKDRALIERFEAEIDNANGNQGPNPKHK